MNHARVIYQLARADFLERVRRHSFLVTLAATVYLGVATAQGNVSLRLGDYRGVFNSAWVGAMMALVTSVFVTLVGFYIVRNSVLRDQQTRVGQILAATPLNRTVYTIGKALSNFAVLAAIVGVLAVAAIVLQLFVAEDRHLHLWALLSPFVFIALPAVAVAAAVAVLFEVTPVLRGGGGNVIYFFVWTFALAAAIKSRAFDPGGLALYYHRMTAAVRAIDPAFKDGFSLTVQSAHSTTKTFLWTGVNWTPALVAERLAYVVLALGIAALCSLWFHRFDPQFDVLRRRVSKAEAAPETTSEAPPIASSSLLTPFTRGPQSSRFVQLVISETKLMLKGRRWWWYAVTAGFAVSGFAVPFEEASGVLLAAWIWPVLTWSQLGAREEFYATRSLVFSAPNAVIRQLGAAWLAGSSLALLLGAGFILRLLAAGNAQQFSSVLIGAFFIPALALALGTLTGNSKSFEAIYTVWWYVGPAHSIAGFDFIGMTRQSANPILYAGFLVACLITAATRRKLALVSK